MTDEQADKMIRRLDKIASNTASLCRLMDKNLHKGSTLRWTNAQALQTIVAYLAQTNELLKVERTEVVKEKTETAPKPVLPPLPVKEKTETAPNPVLPPLPVKEKTETAPNPVLPPVPPKQAP